MRKKLAIGLPASKPRGTRAVANSGRYKRIFFIFLYFYQLHTTARAKYISQNGVFLPESAVSHGALGLEAGKSNASFCQHLL